MTLQPDRSPPFAGGSWPCALGRRGGTGQSRLQCDRRAQAGARPASHRRRGGGEEDAAGRRQSDRNHAGPGRRDDPARVKGFLKEKHFNDGGQVKTGQLLLVIDPVPFQLALNQAEAELEAAKAALRKADASKDPQVANAQLDLDRSQLLLDQVEERRARTLLCAGRGRRRTTTRPMPSSRRARPRSRRTRPSFEQSRADYDINIDTAKAQVASAEAAVANAKVNLGYTKMFAPIDGRIGELKVKVGNLVGDGSATELVTIQQLDPMGLDFRPSARYLPMPRRCFQGAARQPDGRGRPRPSPRGQGYFIDNTVDSTPPRS